ncbi:hypothetical protein O181_096804 [Austropuccinia psidii MF-1]|uniref:Uncharacterized protein n=1 Tax=Austropuccinia psidii MF-1 TaxID=1389203 RepID=A0A9Q3PD06_9BASI|nr:hypothetical protein [Austropuccinia psidii MF-1]
MEPDFKEGEKVVVSTLNFNKLQGPKKTILPDGRGQFPLQKEDSTLAEIVEMENSPGPVKKINKARKIRLHGKVSACDSNPEHKRDSQNTITNGIAKKPAKHRAEPNYLKRYQMKEETHPFPNIQVPSS